MSSRNTRRAVGVFVLVLAASVVAYVWASPLLTIRAMQAAAQRGDADAFSDHVDYPSLRESLKGQFAALAAARLGVSTSHGNGLAALGAAIGVSLAGGLIDTLVQPAIVMRVMQEGRLLPRPGDARSLDGDSPPVASGSNAGRIRWTIERQGLDTFLAHADPAATAGELASKRRITLVLRRSGFASWKLTEIRLPPPD